MLGKQSQTNRLVAIVEPHQEIDRVNVKASQAAFLSTNSNGNVGQAKKKQLTSLRTKKSILVPWDHEWGLDTNNCSLKLHFVEASTDLRARHQREQQMHRKLLLKGLYMGFTDERSPEGAGHRLKKIHRSYDLSIRSQNEICPSDCQQAKLTQSLSPMNKAVAKSWPKPPAGDECDRDELLINSSTKVEAVRRPDGQDSNSVVPSDKSLSQLRDSSNEDILLHKVSVDGPCPRHIIKSKSVDDFLNSRRGFRLKFALKSIRYREL